MSVIVDLGMGTAGSSVGGHEGFPGELRWRFSEVSWTMAGGRADLGVRWVR
jgi:hypothetical protein